MTAPLDAPPAIAALLLRLIERLEAEFSSLAPMAVVRSVETAIATARATDLAGYVDVVEHLARTDLTTQRLSVASDRVWS